MDTRRYRGFTVPRFYEGIAANRDEAVERFYQGLVGSMRTLMPVSYTHLTLPTKA